MNPFRYDSTENKVSALLFLLLAASLPFDRFYSQLLLITVLAHTAIQLRRQRFQQLSGTGLLAHSTVFLLTIAGTALGSFRSEAFPFWERQLALLLLPLCTYLLCIDLRKLRPLLMTVFIAVNCGVALYLFADALRTVRYFGQPLADLWSPAYLSHNFSEPLGLHATYLSLFFALSLLASLQALLQGLSQRWLRAAASLSLLLLGAGLLQLASRAVLAGTLLIAFSQLWMHLSSRKARAAAVLLLLLAGSLGYWLLRQAPHLYQRLVTDLATDLGTQRAAGVIADPRGHRWELAWTLVRQAPLLGHGSGSEVVLLRDLYFRNGLYDSYLHALNAHNVFLSLLIRHGALGLLCWLASLLYFARQAVRERDGLLGGFLLLVFISALSENLLDVNKGIFFYAFFLTLLGLRRKKEPGPAAASNPQRPAHVRINKARKTARL